MDKIKISDLEVFYRVGVPDEERAKPQRLLLTIEMSKDLRTPAATDDLASTINYSAVTQRLLRFGDGRSWKLIEKLASDIAEMILGEFAPESVSVEVRKFIIPQARYVSVRIERSAK
ncbi:MAG TPA: dihydroneopterin aldolase [Candidatus Nitrosotalea sp.]|nr:dihydroneopterin aldolase [Candidatus Nitrosotalea sp.]